MKRGLRIVQIIDRLGSGGAERMAVNYANSLADKVEFSGLIATREEGIFRQMLSDKVAYEFLKKKRSLDLGALLRLRQFIKRHKVTIIQVHSTSFFFATLLKLICPHLKMIWHDHYGKSEFLKERPSKVLKLCSYFFNGVISVNQKLLDWAKEKLHVQNVIYLPNFSPISLIGQEQETILKGKKGKRIICLANLRAQKNHEMLLDVAERLRTKYPDWTYHLVGEYQEEEYSANIKRLILEKGLGNLVFLYGGRRDTDYILQQSTIGVLTSKSEGLPLSLLEYGRVGLPVVATSVGDIPKVVCHRGNGRMVSANRPEDFADELKEFMTDEGLRKKTGAALKQTINKQFSQQAVIKQYINWLKYKQQL